jgi:hypothetical protein
VTDGAKPDEPAEFRQWLSFESQSGDTLLVDTTFLNSNWRCIYGEGCPGIEAEDAPDLARGCCTFGAHITGPDDRARVLDASARLTPDQWQLLSRAGSDGPLGNDADGAEVTRSVDGACVFLNRPDFAAGPGCALHVGALQAGEEPLTWKPDVCWQLPIRVEENVDDDGHVTHTLRSWLRRDWGEGGSDLGWWCTESDGSYEGHEPAYQTLGAELTALLGKDDYAELARKLDQDHAP